MTSWEFAVPVPFPNGIYIAIYKVKTLLKVCLKGYINIPQEMQNSDVKKKKNFWMIFGLKSPELTE